MKIISLLVSIFLFFQAPSIAVAQGNTMQKSDKQLVEAILARLVEARGIPLEKGIPAVVIDAKEAGNDPASSKLDKNILLLSPRTIAICKNFGEYYEDVLAVIVGHELIHFYQQNECRFTHKTRTTDSLEREADIQGLFNAYLAGYRIKGEGSTTLQSRLIARIYEEFGLQEELHGYPSMMERQAMVKEAESVVNDLIRYFEVANYAMLRGYFETAIEFYKYLLNHLNAKEFHQNVSIAYASLYKRLHKDAFDYPFELNTYSGLYLPVRGDKDLEEEAIKEKALKHFCKGSSNTDELLLFETALSLIKGDLRDAESKLEKVKNKGNEKKIKVLLDVLTAKKQGEASLPQSDKFIALDLENCGYTPIMLDYYYADKELTEALSVGFFPKENVMAVQFGEDRRFIVQRFVPSCFESGEVLADKLVPHTRGDFFIFIKESAIFLEIEQQVVQGAKIYPHFPQ